MVPPDLLEVTRFGTLISDYNTLAFYACKFEDTFQEAREQVNQLTEKFKHVCTEHQQPTQNTMPHFNEEIAATHNSTRDPKIVEAKGREKESNRSTIHKQDTKSNRKQKRCRTCDELGHNRVTCKKNTNQECEEDTDRKLPTDLIFISNDNPTQQFGWQISTHQILVKILILPLVSTTTVITSLHTKVFCSRGERHHNTRNTSPIDRMMTITSLFPTTYMPNHFRPQQVSNK